MTACQGSTQQRWSHIFYPEPSLASSVFYSTVVSIKQESYCGTSHQVGTGFWLKAQLMIKVATGTSHIGWTTGYSILITQFCLWGNWLKVFLLVLLPWKWNAIIIISLFQCWLINFQRESLTKRIWKFELLSVPSVQGLWVHESVVTGQPVTI